MNNPTLPKLFRQMMKYAIQAGELSDSTDIKYIEQLLENTISLILELDNKEFRDLHEKVMDAIVATEGFGGQDNLAILLCSIYEEKDEEMDYEAGWSKEAMFKYKHMRLRITNNALKALI